MKLVFESLLTKFCKKNVCKEMLKDVVNLRTKFQAYM